MMVTQVPPPSASRDGAGPASAPPLRPVAPPRIARALRAAFYGEFRPHVPLALVLLASCGVMAGLVGFSNYNHDYYYGGHFDNILANDLVRFLTLVGCPLIGLVLGAAQARRDVAVEVWGFMAHRPVSGALLFAGRVLAGGALYGIAAGLPLAALLAFAASPGGGLPFHWRFMLPALADGLSGLIWYVACLLAAQRESRWAGSRYLPVLTALGCTVLVAVVPAFWEAVVVIAAAAVVYALAALGSAQTHGYRLPGRPWARWATGAVLLAALTPIFLGGGVALQYGNLYLADMAARKLRVGEKVDYSVKAATSFVLLEDGTLGIRIYEPAEPRDPQEDALKYVRYERVWPVKEKLDWVETDARRRTVAPVEFQYPVPVADSYRKLTWQVSPVYSPAAGDTKSPAVVKEQWYYVATPGVYLGYDAVSHAYLGSLGENGFAPPGQRAAPFGVVGGDSQIITPRGKFEVNLERRTVTQRWAFPAEEKVWFFGHIQPLSDSSDLRGQALTRDRMLVYTGASTKPALALPLAYGPDTHVISAAWFAEQQRWALWYEPKNDQYRNNVVEFFDQAGTRLGRVDIAERVAYEWRGNPPTELNPGQKAILRRAMAGAGAIQAAGGLPGHVLMDHFITGASQSADYADWDRFMHTPKARPYAWSYRWAAGLTLALSAAGMWLLARRYNVRHKWAWVAATVVLGPVMMVLLAALHTLPLRVRCPACQKRRFAGEACCGHCGAAFPGPARGGTEIFT